MATLLVRKTTLFIVAMILLPAVVLSFVSPFFCREGSSRASTSTSTSAFTSTTTRLFQQQQLSVQVEATLDDEKIKALFAWIARAYAGDYEYNNLMIAIAAVFGNLPEDSEPIQMRDRALLYLPDDAEENPCGEPFSLYERESNSLGAMGAAQWTGQWRTRPHALLEVQNLTHVDDWIKTLPRGCKRTIKRAIALEEGGNFTVRTLPIMGGEPAPHSCLAHFRCVVEHEVRLYAGEEGSDVSDFFSALGEAVGRYMGTTRMAGEIREYRNTTTGRVIALAHEVRKGKTVRGQWFYATDQASKNYVWFHSVYDLVRRSIDAEGIDVVDLGPSGSDAFSDLKERYGFASVDDWPAVADYEGPFFYNNSNDDARGMKGILETILNKLGDDE